MSPRPRKASDQDVFAAVYRVMMRQTPGEVTLGEIGREAGVTAGALVQRFGSKRALLLAVAEQSAASAGQMIEQLRAAHGSPVAALYGYADCLASMGETPAGFAHHLSWLQLDLTDEDFRRHLRTQSEATRLGLRGLLEEAVAAGELRADTDTEALTRAVEVTLTGSLMTWGFHQEGPAKAWLRHDLSAVLEPRRAKHPIGGGPRRG